MKQKQKIAQTSRNDALCDRQGCVQRKKTVGGASTALVLDSVEWDAAANAGWNVEFCAARGPRPEQ